VINRVKISAVIISLNEEKDIGRCLESLQGIADEILVLDSFSSDGTEKICRSFGVRFEQHAFDGYVSQKNRATSMATYDYILSLDADEALSEEMKEEVSRIKEEWRFDGYIFNRRNSWCGRWMRFTTLYPDRKLRLFDRRKAVWDGLDPHDYVKPDKNARIVRATGDLLHWAIHSIEEQKNKTDHFARISAQSYLSRGIKARFGSAFFHSLWRWFREYCVRLGFLEGYAGWQIARYSALYAWKKYYYLRQLYESQR
jgi:glycosyltransferase involved in cell wall biosynthesis